MKPRGSRGAVAADIAALTTSGWTPAHQGNRQVDLSQRSLALHFSGYYSRSLLGSRR